MNNEKRSMITKQAFINLCQTYKLAVPEIEIVDGDSELYTGPSLVQLSSTADLRHVFGHFLIDMHEVEPDLVADIIAELLVNSSQLNRALTESTESVEIVHDSSPPE